MPNTTDTYWEASGVSLQTLVQNITTLSGRDVPPTPRGEDEIIPHQEGENHIPKVIGSRTLSLGMWVVGSTKAEYDANWRALRNLLWNQNRQFELKKRFTIDGVVRSATALAEYRGGLEPTMMGRRGNRFTVNLKLADPYFYDDVLVSQAIVNGDNVVTMKGDAETKRINLSIEGARTNPLILNSTLDVQVKYNDVLSSGDLAEIDIQRKYALTTPDGEASYKSSSKITHAGAAHWLALAPGANTVNVSSTFGIGVITLEARSAWL